jgi:hypothetical protein
MGLFDAFTTTDQDNAARLQSGAITTGVNKLTDAYNQGQNQLQTNYAAGLQPFQQNYSADTAGQTQLGNLLGLNGASGNSSALSTLQNTPGYQFQLQQGDNAVNAADWAKGQGNSGNQLLDLSKFNQGLAGTNYFQNVAALQPYMQSANVNASGISNAYSNLGNQLNANSMGQGNAQYGANASIGNAQANAALSGVNASANQLGAITGLGGALMGFLSDPDAKEDKAPVGELYDGTTVWRYRYKGDPRHQIGLMADEVEPDAVFDMGGMRGVDYKRATDKARSFGEGLMRFAA